MKSEILPGIVSGEQVGAWALTEAHCGSDAAASVWKVRAPSQLAKSGQPSSNLRGSAAPSGPVKDLRALPLSKLVYDSTHVTDPDYATAPWERTDISPDFAAWR